MKFIEDILNLGSREFFDKYTCDDISNQNLLNYLVGGNILAVKLLGDENKDLQGIVLAVRTTSGAVKALEFEMVECDCGAHGENVFSTGIIDPEN